MTTATKTRKPARVTHGTCRLLCWPAPLAESLETGGCILELLPQRGRPTNYFVQTIRDDAGRLCGYRLSKIGGKGEVYDIDVTAGYGWQCDCPDAEFQGRECKHVHALRAALAAKGIALETPRHQTAAAVEPTAFDDP